MQFTRNKKRSLDDEINRLVELLSKVPPGTVKYEKISKNLQSLCDARSLKSHSAITMDTVILVVSNITVTLLVLNYEQLHVVSSKALSFALKGVRL